MQPWASEFVPMVFSLVDSGMTAQLIDNQLIDLVLSKRTCNSNGVLDRWRARRAVADNANAINAQQRRAAILAVVISLHQGFKGTASGRMLVLRQAGKQLLSRG